MSTALVPARTLRPVKPWLMSLQDGLQRVPYPAQLLTTLYGNYANYTHRYEAAKQESIKAGFLLPEHAMTIKPIASPASFTTEKQ